MNYLNALYQTDNTCMIYDNDILLFESNKKGVAPLLEYLDNKREVSYYLILVDKVIGRGAVILAQLIGIKEIYTPVISKDALELANEYHIHCEYSSEVPLIINRNKTGRCPIENSVLGITDPVEGYELIKSTLQKLKKAT